jgi:hypothetical protein
MIHEADNAPGKAGAFKFPCYRSPGDSCHTVAPQAAEQNKTRHRKWRAVEPPSGGGDQIRVEQDTHLAAQHLEQDRDAIVIGKAVEKPGTV